MGKCCCLSHITGVRVEMVLRAIVLPVLQATVNFASLHMCYASLAMQLAYIYPIPSPRAEYDTMTIFKQSTSCLEVLIVLVGWLVGSYGISTFEGYLTLNPFL